MRTYRMYRIHIGVVIQYNKVTVLKYGDFSYGLCSEADHDIIARVLIHWDRSGSTCLLFMLMRLHIREYGVLVYNMEVYNSMVGLEYT